MNVPSMPVSSASSSAKNSFGRLSTALNAPTIAITVSTTVSSTSSTDTPSIASRYSAPHIGSQSRRSRNCQPGFARSNRHHKGAASAASASAATVATGRVRRSGSSMTSAAPTSGRNTIQLSQNPFTSVPQEVQDERRDAQGDEQRVGADESGLDQPEDR